MMLIDLPSFVHVIILSINSISDRLIIDKQLLERFK
jgi:hypothetical protein